MDRPENVYETERLLQEYLLFHYGSAEEQMPWPEGPKDALNFPQRCVEFLEIERLSETCRALDLGCAVGRSTFELARHCGEVIGIDYSHAFIMAAKALARDGELPYAIPETGHIVTDSTAKLPEGIDCKRTRFEQGDAQSVRADIGLFDALLCCNLLCRLHRPRALLDRLPSLVRSGGQLLITTPNTWLEEFTAKDFWLGATPETGEPLEVIEEELAPHFRLERTGDLPFVIREHRRKYQWSVAQASLWRRV